VVKQLSNDAASTTAGVPRLGKSGAPDSSASPSSNPSDSLNLSDHAKTVLARAQTEQVAADKHQTFL
jgi:hypothetical protein